MNPRLKPKTCATCGVEFMGGATATYCQVCRADRARQQDRERHQRKLAGKIRHIGSTAYCDVCGKPYTVNAGKQKYCQQCQKVEGKKRWRESYERMKSDPERWALAVQRSREWAIENKERMAEILHKSYVLHKFEKMELRRIKMGFKRRNKSRGEIMDNTYKQHGVKVTDAEWEKILQFISDMRAKKCEICGDVFSPKRMSNKYCPKCAAARIAEANKRKEPQPRKCIGCGEEFMAKKKSDHFCAKCIAIRAIKPSAAKNRGK